jgi:hypothetical protein
MHFLNYIRQKNGIEWSIDKGRGDNMRNILSRCIESESNTNMICLEAQYFNLNRILLQATALWPFQQSKIVQFQFITILTILVTAIICQVKITFTLLSTGKYVININFF